MPLSAHETPLNVHETPHSVHETPLSARGKPLPKMKKSVFIWNRGGVSPYFLFLFWFFILAVFLFVFYATLDMPTVPSFDSFQPVTGGWDCKTRTTSDPCEHTHKHSWTDACQTLCFLHVRAAVASWPPNGSCLMRARSKPCLSSLAASQCIDPKRMNCSLARLLEHAGNKIALFCFSPGCTPNLDGQNRQSPIACIQRTQSTLASHAAVPCRANATWTNANRAIRFESQHNERKVCEGSSLRFWGRYDRQRTLAIQIAAIDNSR